MSRYGRGYGYGGYDRYRGFAPYVPVANRVAKGMQLAKKLAAEAGRPTAPVKITTRAIATTFWGKAWCENLEIYSDFANRLPRGRTYARNGSIADLQIARGKIEAIVGGSDAYKIVITIDTLAPAKWTQIKAECSQSIASLIDLLQGRFDEGVMQRLAHPTDGLFPQPKEIKLACSCPDSARLCKHVAAVLYGVGNRLDTAPELLFTLRNVDHLELISQAVAESNLDRTLDAGENSLAGSDLGEMFGIELDAAAPSPAKTSRAKPSRVKKAAAKKAVAKKPAVKKPGVKKSAVKKSAVKKSKKEPVAIEVAAAVASADKREASTAIAEPKTGRKKAAPRKRASATSSSTAVRRKAR